MPSDHERAFAYRGIITTRQLVALEEELGQPLADTASWRPREISIFPQALRREAAQMARLYEVFYCLERTVRDLVRKALQDEQQKLRENRIEPQILQELRRRQEQEKRSGITPREGDVLEYATLGELGQVIDANWDEVFHEYLEHREAAKRLITNLNSLRSPVAHSIPVPHSEANRLGVFLQDWARLNA